LETALFPELCRCCQFPFASLLLGYFFGTFEDKSKTSQC